MKDFWKKEGHKRKSKPSNKNIVIYFSAIISLYFLEKYNQYTLILAMILITAVILLCRNWRLIWAKVKNKNFERKNLKNLKYYFILDGKKRADLKKRKEIYSLFGDYAMHVALFFSLALVFIFDIARSVFHEVPFFAVSLSIGLSIIMILIFGGTILQIVYKFTTLTYVFIPAISCVIMNIFWESYFPASLAINLPDFAQISIYLVITIILYIMFSLFFPVYILRRLSERTALFSALVSILTSVAGQIFLFLSTRYFEGQLQSFTQKNIQNTSQISDSVKKIIFDNPELLKAVRYFAVKEATSQVISAVSLLSTVLTVSYLVGGLIINSKIQSNKNKAGQLYRECIKNADSVKYDQLRKCAFWGGEDYENLLLSNPQFQRVILDIESEIIVSENRVEKKLFDSKLLGRSK